MVGELGELVITKPMPSMPVRFWNDPGDERYRAAYFDLFPGVWRQGDWIRFTDYGSCVITGRSDATLNRAGVRFGTSEIYVVVEQLPQVSDSLVVHLEDDEGGPGELVLFVAPADGAALDDELRATIARALRSELSPRHVPDTIVAVPAIPRTLTGKKLETPGQADPAGPRRGRGRQPRRARRPVRDRRVRRLRGPPARRLRRTAKRLMSGARTALRAA